MSHKDDELEQVQCDVAPTPHTRLMDRAHPKLFAYEIGHVRKPTRG